MICRYSKLFKLTGSKVRHVNQPIILSIHHVFTLKFSNMGETKEKSIDRVY